MILSFLSVGQDLKLVCFGRLYAPKILRARPAQIDGKPSATAARCLDSLQLGSPTSASMGFFMLVCHWTLALILGTD